MTIPGFTPGKVPNGAVLLLGISFERLDQVTQHDGNRGMTSPKVFTYAALKIGGLWYLTGSGKVPTAAGWPAVERWLSRDGRVVEWVQIASSWTQFYSRVGPTCDHPTGTGTTCGVCGADVAEIARAMDSAYPLEVSGA